MTNISDQVSINTIRKSYESRFDKKSPMDIFVSQTLQRFNRETKRTSPSQTTYLEDWLLIQLKEALRQNGKAPHEACANIGRNIISPIDNRV